MLPYNHSNTSSLLTLTRYSYTTMPTLTHAVNQQDEATTSAADDGKVIARTLAALKTLAIEYECPICLDAHHRFCGDCIKESLRRCNNECPSCRVYIPTKRTMRKNTQFDKIVSVYIHSPMLCDAMLTFSLPSMGTSLITQVQTVVGVIGSLEKQMTLYQSVIIMVVRQSKHLVNVSRI